MVLTGNRDRRLYAANDENNRNDHNLKERILKFQEIIKKITYIEFI